MNAKIKKFGFPLPIAGASGGSKSPSVPREDPDNLQSSAYVNIIDLIGEGQIGGLVDNVDGDSLTEKEKSIFFDGTRLRHTNGELNFANVSWAERVGLQRQDYIEGFGEGVETPFYKNVQLKSGIPSAFTVSNPNADRVRIILAVNSLLSTDRSSGDTYGTSVEFQIKLSVNNGPYEILATKKITGKTTSRYQRSFSFDLPKKKADGTPITAWSFQITRTTPDSNSSYLQNTTFFESYSEVELTKFSYPNVALVATRFSSETFSSIPKREYLVDGLLIKVPSNRNKDGSYTGPWDGTFKLESSSNPAWILYDLLLSKRYGLGEYITPEMIDESRLYVIGQYCDQLVDDGFGNKEPRYTINCVINTRVEAYDLIVDICSAFNGMAYWAGHMVGFTIDAPGTPQMLFNNTNIVGDFSYQGTSNKDRHSVAVVTWNDPNDDYKQVPEVVEDPELIERYGIRKTEVMAFGCTSRGQAARYGRWLLYSEHQQSETITFNVGIDAALLLPGDLIYVQDRDRAGKRFGGRLLDCTAKQAVLDDLVDFGEFTDLTLVIRLEDGSLAERVIASHTKKTVTVSGHTKEVTVVEWAEALTVMPVKYALWIIKAAELQPVIARVVNVAQGEEKGTYNITAVPHNPNKYQSIENDLMLDVPPTSILNSRNQEPPASVEIKSEIITTQNVAKTRLVISWKEAKNAARYEVEWKRNDGNWVKLPQTTSLSIEVEDVYAGAYTARVVAYNLFGARSYPKYSTSTDVKGKVGKPTNVLSLTTTPLLFGMKLDWVYPAGNSDLSHVVIEVSDRADGSNPRLLGNVSYPTNTLTIQGLQGGLDQWYRTKTVDKSGNESDWSNFVKGTTGNDPDQVLDLISGQIGESDLATELQGKIENSVTVSEAAKIVADNAQTAATNAQTAATDAKTAASEAQKAASSAQTQASSAQQIASEASATAANAKNAADQAVTAANQAKTAADNAATTAATASSTASKAQTTANDAAAAASKVASDLTTSTNQLNKKIADETDARTVAISKLNDGLTIETSQRKTEDAALLSNIETYKSSTNGTLSSLQTQINTNATNTSANTSKISSLDSRLTTNEGKTADAINAAATAQQTASSAVDKANAVANSVTALKSELSSGKGINNIVAPFSDPQELPALGGASRTVALVDSALRRNGKAYKVSFTAAAHYVYFGTAQAALAPSQMAMQVEAGRAYTFSVWLKALSTAVPSFRFNILWFIRDPSTGNITTNAGIIFPQGQTDSYIAPNANGQRYSFRPVNSPANAIGATVYVVGNPSGPSAGEYLIDMLMLEESVGSEKPASTWTAGPADLNAIKNALDTNAVAINNLITRVSNNEGKITSQGNLITQLNNSINTINGTLSNKADATALNALTTRVSNAEGQISSQGSSIVSLQNDLASTNKAVSTKADSSALNSLDSKVSEIDGRVTSNANAVTSLQGSVSSIEKGLSTKADASALNNYYTKTEADSAASGAIDKFNSQLTIGGVNVVANSEAPRTSTAATNREYLLYERSAELKAFYDENLEKPITISFEMSVPVAGPVQVYSSNGSAHQFVTSVNAIIVNQFAKYSVTVSPKAHTASTTVSTIEFYGTYGTGRIPTIRKLQIEAGTKATAWSPSPRDTKAAIDANASAIQTTQTKVDNIDGRLTTATDSITSLNSRMSTAEGNINSTNTAVGGLSTRMATAEGKITNQSDSIASLQNSVTSINGTLANKADSSAVNNLTSRVETAEGKISSQSGQITSLSNSLDLTNSNLNDVNVLARLLSLGKPLRDDPTFKLGMGGLAPYALQSGSTLTRQAVSADNPTESTYEVLLRATTTLGSGWYPNNPTVLGGPNKAFLVKQVIKMPTGQRVYPYNNPLGTGGFVRMLGNAEGTGKFETYYSIIQCGPDASKSIQGHFRVINSTNPPVPTTSNPVDVILASYEVFDVTAVNDTIPKAYSDAISANANAINSLSNSVTQQGNTITSHSNSITSLNNSITSINSSLTNKADASALNNLSNRVTAAEGNITSQGNSITSLNNTLTNNDLSNLVLNPDFIDPKNGWTSGVIVDATDAAPNPPSLKALKLNNRDSYYGPFVKCNVGDMFYVSAWFATPNTSATASAVIGFNTRNSAGTYTWYTVAVKSTDKNAWGFVEGYFTVPAGMVDIRPWLQVSIAASEAAGQQWHVTNIQVRNITGNKKLATDLQATSSALSTLDSKVTNIDGRVTSASNSIVSLNNSVTNINTALSQKADAAALNSLSNRVTTAEGNITSQGNSITSLTNSLAVSGKGGTNLLIKSNVVGTYDGISYPHHTYKLGEDWEIGATYTLIWCAEHKRGTGDTNSSLAVYEGGGSQHLQAVVNTNGKVVSKVTFVKNSAVASGPIIHFYMLNRPTADKGSVGTVYWAVLVKGDVLTTDAWIPSAYDYIPDSNANASAITNLTNTVTQQGNTLTSHTNSITSLNNSITSINGVLNTKANTSAVSDLDSRVTDAEGKITANTSSITSLTANLKSTSNGITMSASIDVDPDSEWIYWTKNGEVVRADDTSALGGKVYRFGNNAGNDHVNARSKAKLPFDQNKTYRIRARYRRVSGTGTIYCAVFGIAKDGVSHVNSSNTVTTDAGSSNYFVTNQAPALNAWQEVTVYVKGRAAGAATGGWTLDNPRQLPNATAFISVQFLANYSSAAGEVDLDYLIIEDADAIAANDATAKALSSLDTRVTTAEGKITSQGNSITQLNNSITTINGTLSTKADSSALTNLANRVTTAENSITSQGSSITSLNSSVTGILKDIEVTDTRSTNQPPSWYWSNYPKRIVREFKQASTIGLSGMGTYVSLETYVYYSDATGGPIIQIARGTDSKLTAERRSTSTSTWGTWVQDIKAISDGLANKAEASALSSLDSKVSVIDGKVSTQASSITTLQTTVGGNTASIQSQQQSIDGLKARATLKLQSGNLVGGVGIENDSKTVDFIIQANKFAIGAPSDVTSAVTPKYAFTYQSTPTTLPNGTVIPAGLYLDSASISYINANKIYADSLSAISANLGTFTSLADQSKPNGARTVISGERIEVYDENNVMRVRIGRW